jgi:hypothetical protein
MKYRVTAIAVAVAILAAGVAAGQETLLREDGSLSEAGAMTEQGQPVIWHSVSVDERSRVQVTVVSVDFAPILLLERNNQRIREHASAAGAATGAVFLEAGEQLRVGVSSDPAAEAGPPLSFSLRAVAGPAPELLQPGETRGGDLTEDDERLDDGRVIDWYPLRLEKGQRVRLELQSVEFDAFLRMRTPAGGVLENDDLESTDAGLVYTAVEPGIAQVGATAFGASERGAYQLVVQELEPPRELEVGSTVNGRLGSDGSHTDDYMLSGKAGQMVLVQLESNDFDTVLRLRADGGFHAENDDAEPGTTDSELFYSFLEDGVVTVQAASFSAEEGGSYRLSALRFVSDEDYPTYREGRRLEIGQEFEGMLTAAAPSAEGRYYHEFTLAAEEGRLVSVSLTSDLFDPYLEIYSPSGREFADDDSGGAGDAYLELEAPESGVYRVRATTYGPGGLGTYAVSYEESEPRALVAEFEGEIDADSPVDETGRPFSEDRYSARTGETAVIEARSAEFDPILTVFDPQGRLVAENDDYGTGWNSRVEIEFEQTGVYTIVVSAYWDDQSGSYRVVVEE